MAHTITLIPGDGIGPEVVEAAVRAVEATGVAVQWERVSAGASAIPVYGSPIPDEALESVRRNKVALKGPLETPIGKGYRSVNVALRKEFDLYANVRPVRSFRGVNARYTDVDLVVVRENTEDLYSGVEHFIGKNRMAAESISIITREGSERIAHYAFEYAVAHKRREVVIVHKANILKCTGGLFLDVCREVARGYPSIICKDVIVDACCMKLVLDPTRFDVIVTTNLFGDILSDLTAGLVGGLGLTGAGNIGETGAIFEAVHGTAPDIVGKGMANPTAVMLSAAMMLEHLGDREAGARLERAVREAIAAREDLTPDLGGSGTTETFTRAVVRRLS